MKIKIAIVYLLAFLVLFLTSCSEIIDTNAKELKANVWVEKDDDNLNCKLQFIDDKGKFTLQDKKDNKSYIITGVTVVTENDFTINHRETLSKYIFKYKITVFLYYFYSRTHGCIIHGIFQSSIFTDFSHDK